MALKNKFPWKHQPTERKREKGEEASAERDRLLWQRRSSLQTPHSYWQEWLFVCLNRFPLGVVIGKEVTGCHLGQPHTDPGKSSHTFWIKSSCRQWLCFFEHCKFTDLVNELMISTLDKSWITPRSLVVSWWVKKVKLVYCFRDCNKGIYFNFSGQFSLVWLLAEVRRTFLAGISGFTLARKFWKL